MDRRNALKMMGTSLAALAMAGIAPRTHAAIMKDRANEKKRLVFYFTATGNSLFVARQFSDNPLSIPQELKKTDLSYEADEIGFVFPDFAAAAPLIVRDFIQKAKFNAPYIFSVITFGNASVNVAEWWQKYAMENGVVNNYVNTILMVDNYLPVFDMNQQMTIDKKIDESLAGLLEDIGAHKSFVQPADMGWFNEEGLKRLQDQHFSMTADRLLEMRADRCIECMTCEKVCPHKNFRIGANGLEFSGKCEYCLACVHNCPMKAISIIPTPPEPEEANRNARFRNPNVSVADLIKSNSQI